MSRVRTVQVEVSRVEAEELARTLRRTLALLDDGIRVMEGPQLGTPRPWAEVDAVRVRRVRLTAVLDKLVAAAGVPLRELGL